MADRSVAFLLSSGFSSSELGYARRKPRPLAYTVLSMVDDSSISGLSSNSRCIRAFGLVRWAINPSERWLATSWYDHDDNEDQRTSSDGALI